MLLGVWWNCVKKKPERVMTSWNVLYLNIRIRQGASHRFISNIASRPPRYLVGASVNVQYDPKDPADGREAAEITWLLPLLGGGLLVAVFGGGGIHNFCLTRPCRKIQTQKAARLMLPSTSFPVAMGIPHETAYDVRERPERSATPIAKIERTTMKLKHRKTPKKSDAANPQATTPPKSPPAQKKPKSSGVGTFLAEQAAKKRGVADWHARGKPGSRAL